MIKKKNEIRSAITVQEMQIILKTTMKGKDASLGEIFGMQRSMSVLLQIRLPFLAGMYKIVG